MRSQIGCVTIPDQLLLRIIERKEVSSEESAMCQNHPRVGADLIGRIPRLEGVARAVALQHSRFSEPDMSAAPGEPVPVAARILKAALDYDSLKATGLSHGSAMLRLEARQGWYDPSVMAALDGSQTGSADGGTVLVSIEQLKPGMVLAEDLVTDSGFPIARAGQEISAPSRFRIQNFRNAVAPDRRFRVVLPPQLNEITDEAVLPVR